MYGSGADAIILDTVGAAGDADYMAGLKAAEILKEKYAEICIELGMAGEFVLGMHGDLFYDDNRLAGVYPHEQVKVAQKAGVTIFGPVCNTNTNESAPWNLSRAITFMKACCEEADIPVHVNMGMGVGAMTVHDHPPLDVSSRGSKAMVEICRLDGLSVGVGDPFGMAITHAIASGMGGMRTAGDLVARMQIARGMKIGDAKKYVADKLSVAVADLTDPIIMKEVREDLNLGLLHPHAGSPKCMEAKFNIARLLDIDINCVRRFREKASI